MKLFFSLEKKNLAKGKQVSFDLSWIWLPMNSWITKSFLYRWHWFHPLAVRPEKPLVFVQDLFFLISWNLCATTILGKIPPTTIVEKIPLILAHSTDDSMIFASKHEFVWTSGPLDPRVHHFPFADVLELRSDQLIIIFPHSTTILWVYGIHPFSNILTLGDFPIRGARPMTPSSLFPQWLGEDQKNGHHPDGQRVGMLRISSTVVHQKCWCNH